MRSRVYLTIISVLMIIAVVVGGCATGAATPATSPATPASAPAAAATAPAAPTTAAAAPTTAAAAPTKAAAAPTKAAAAPSGEPIKMGFIGPFSSVPGLSNKAAVEIAVEEINAEGGILGRPVQLLVEDDKGQTPLAVAAYRKLVMTEKCKAIFGQGSDIAVALQQEGSKLYAEYPHILYVTFSQADSLTEAVCADHNKYKFFFRSFFNSADYLAPENGVASFIKNTVGAKKIALLIEDYEGVRSWITGSPGKYPPMKEWLEQNGMEVVYFTKTAVGEKMWLPIMQEVAKSGADSILWVMAYSDHIAAAKQWAESPAKDLNVIAGGGAVAFQSFWDSTGGAALGMAPIGPDIMVPYTNRTAPFVEKLHARGAGLVASTFNAHIGPFFVKAAFEQVGNTTDIEALIKAMETIEVQRTAWKLKFDKCHDTVNGYPYEPIVYGQHQGPGKFVIVHPEEARVLANPNDKYIPVKELRKKFGQ